MAASLRNSRVILRPNEEASFPLHGDSIRLTAANVPIYFKTRDGSLNFFLVSGETAEFEGNDFIDLVMYHMDAADQAVIVSIGKDARIGSALVSGAVSITGGTVELGAASLAALESIDLNAETLKKLQYETYAASFANNTNLAANTAEMVFSAALNVNGAVVVAASLATYQNGSTGDASLLAKATAPVSVIDGDVILSCDSKNQLSTSFSGGASLQRAILIPSGKGLYFIAQGLETNGGVRRVLYTLL